jgi:hypothetical protein
MFRIESIMKPELGIFICPWDRENHFPKRRKCRLWEDTGKTLGSWSFSNFKFGSFMAQVLFLSLEGRTL